MNPPRASFFSQSWLILLLGLLFGGALVAVHTNLSPVIVIPASGGATLPVTDPSELLDGASPDRFFTTADDGRGQLSTPAASRTLMRATATIGPSGASG